MASPLTETAEYKALQAHHEQTKGQHMRALFEKDKERFKKFRQALYIIEFVPLM